jgi:hypothetical protein
MMRVEYFTTLAKLGPGKKGSFTSVLISMVFLAKTLKLPELKDASENDYQNNERMRPCLSFIPPFTLFPSSDF